MPSSSSYDALTSLPSHSAPLTKNNLKLEQNESRMLYEIKPEILSNSNGANGKTLIPTSTHRQTSSDEFKYGQYAAPVVKVFSAEAPDENITEKSKPLLSHRATASDEFRNNGPAVFNMYSSDVPSSQQTYLKMDTNDDKFPILVRRKETSNSTANKVDDLSSDFAAALDLAAMSANVPEMNGASKTRHSSAPYVWSSNSSGNNRLGEISRIGHEKRPSFQLDSRMNSLDIPKIPSASSTPPPPPVGSDFDLSRSSSSSGYNVRVGPQQAQQTNLHQQSHMGPPFAGQRATSTLNSPLSNMSAYNGDYYGMSGVYGQSMNCFIPYSGNGLYGSGAVNGGLTAASTKQQTPKQYHRPGVVEVTNENSFDHMSIDDLRGNVYAMCSDQHGCRFLQKKLEEGNPEMVALIFEEVSVHAVDLMTDSFGNYLCQKLFEKCNDLQRTSLVESVAGDLVNISLNLHGTRAVQNLIDNLSNPRQIQLISKVLKGNVVNLIKDLNGNHVIQKCVNKLNPRDFQFIFDAISANCVEVATHRHGCCVLQRFFDHANKEQKLQLINEILSHCMVLSQDSYGNYVMQYVMDLREPSHISHIARCFMGNVFELSMQKFSSNVVEKCIRLAEPSERKILIDELMVVSELERLLRDSFGNYVIQTALDYSDGVQHEQLVMLIKPLLFTIKSTPYSRRIMSKIAKGSNPQAFFEPQNYVPPNASSINNPHPHHSQHQQIPLHHSPHPLQYVPYTARQQPVIYHS